MTADTPPIKLYTALLAAQRAFGPVFKNTLNPHLKSKYADLGAVLDTIEQPLWDNGLIIVQRFASFGDGLALITELVHVASGEFISSYTPVVSKDATDPQKIGAAITYYRRYSLLALLGLAPEDDDGNSASQPPRRDQQPAARLNGQQRYDHARQHGKDPATNDAPMWNDIEDAMAEDARRYAQRAAGGSQPHPAPPARTTPPAAQPVAPSAPQQPFTTAQFRKTLDRAHELLEDGAPYARLVDFLNAARPSMTAEQKEEARLELPKLQAKIAERDAATLAPPAPRPASYAG